MGDRWGVDGGLEGDRGRRGGSVTRQGRRGPRARVLVVPALAVLAATALAVGPRDGPWRGPQALASGAGDPVVVAAGDIACDPRDSSFNGGSGTSNSCRQARTADLINSLAPAGVLALGDNQYYCGSLSAFQAAYDRSWGAFKAITHAAVGNHEYLTSGGSSPATGCDSTNSGAAGHYAYFGAAAGEPSKGYYSFDVGTWHVVVLNSNCSSAGGCGTGSPQYKWLSADLDAHPVDCTMAAWHIPVYSSGGRASSNAKYLWQLLHAKNADVVLTGHDHIYERFAPQNGSGARDDVRGIRAFVVGTGGSNHTSLKTTAANSEVRNASTYGVLALTLHPEYYDWRFVPEAGATFTDSGATGCHGPSGSLDKEAPSVPQGLTGSAPSSSQVDLAWSPATDNAGVAGYAITRDGVRIATSPTTSFVDRAVAATTSYSYRVAAYDASGNTSAPSDPWSVTTPQGPTVMTFTASADTFVEQGAASTSYGGLASIQVDNSPVKKVLMRFPVTGVTGRTVVSATLRLYCLDSSSSGGDVRRVTGSWDESTTWNTQPAIDPTVGASLSSVTSGSWHSVDVTSMVTGDGDLSLALTSGSSNGADYTSREGSPGFGPQLVVAVAG